MSEIKILIPNGASVIVFNASDILYFETVNTKICVTYLKEDRLAKLEFTYAVRDLVDKLADKGFVKIHRGIIVSIQHIKQINSASLVLDDKAGTVLPISRMFVDTLFQALEKEKNYILLI